MLKRIQLKLSIFYANLIEYRLLSSNKFLQKEIRDLFVNYSGNSKEYSELAQSLPFGFVI